ncbi:universal stress protein [Halobacteriales archaeon QS_1_68_20]|nr:MAG: universal stress protein [Halobacteriales archaeon QS_1_68_20]
MTRVVVPVRYPLSKHSKRTLSAAIDVASEEGAELTVLHVDLYQRGRTVTRRDLREDVEAELGRLQRARYAIRDGFLVEETILEEVAQEDADVVVIGHRQAGRFRRVLRRVFDGPDVEKYLRQKLDCEVVTVD